jgi:peroxiredoxin
VQQRYAEVQALGGEVLAVSFTRPQRLVAYLAGHPLPFPALADPERAAYRALGLGRTSWRALWRLRILARYLGLIFRGWLPRRSAEGEDVLQLGGDFVIDRQSRLTYAHPSAEPTDRPSAEELLQALRAAAGQ